MSGEAGVKAIHSVPHILPAMPQSKLQQAFDHAVEHQQAGRLREAETLYRRILTDQPDHADSLHNLGLIAQHSGRSQDAAELIRKAIARKPNFPNGYFNLGNILVLLGRVDDAIAAYQQAIVLKPHLAEAHNYLGMAFLKKGEPEQAIDAFRRATSIDPEYKQAQNNLSSALLSRRRFDETIRACQHAIAAKANSPAAWNNLGIAKRCKGEFDQAIAAFDRAIALDPGYAEAYCNRGAAMRENGVLDESLESCRKSIAINPNLAEAYNILGNLLKDTGDVDGAMSAFRRAIELKPDFAIAHSNLVFNLHYPPGIKATEIAEEHFRWDRQHAKPLPKFAVGLEPDSGPAIRGDPDRDRRLRIGYVSPDFRDHAVARFLLPLMTHHDRQAVEIVAYSNVRVPDALTEHFRGLADHWRDVVGLSDAEAADQIREDQIDILVDLAGHTADHRLLIFAHKPARIQATYLGYPDTTGLSAIDYRITDAHADPPGMTERYHSEQLIRLNPCAWCFGPPVDAPVPIRLSHSHAHTEPITFGCFNTFAKVTVPMLQMWSRILLAVPRSHLLLKSDSLGSLRLQAEVRRRMAELGITADRLELRGKEREYSGHLGLYGKMDIALDTFPYHGTTTTCEALWMGVPVISLAGSTHVSRVGVSLLTSVGLPELVAETPEQYVDVAAKLANDASRLNDLHLTLRERMRRSPLTDGRGLARNIEAAYRQMWRTSCQLHCTIEMLPPLPPLSSDEST